MFNLQSGSTGIGADIVEINRFQGLKRETDNRLLCKLFTLKELDYCFSYADPAEHLAARFAGKEAVIKALSALDKKTNYKDIEITNDERGIPAVSILKDGFEGIRILLTLSHSRNEALAFAIVLR